MHARITHYKMKAGSNAEARKILERVKSEIMALPGIRQFYNAMAEDGSGCIVSLFEPAELTEDSADRVEKVWANFSHLLEKALKPETFEVIADWSK